MIPLYVVDTTARRDRRVALEEWLSSRGFDSVTYASDCGASVDWHELKPKHLDELELFPWREAGSTNKWWDRELKLGEIACSLAHHNIWEMIADGDRGWSVVIEDDAVIDVSAAQLDGMLHELTSVAPDIGLVYLDRRPWGQDEPSDALPDGVVYPGFSACLHAYALSNAGAASLCRLDVRRSVMPVDDFVPAAIGVHPRPDIDSAVEPVLRHRAVAFTTSVARVLPREDWGSGTEESPFLTDWLEEQSRSAV